MYILVVLLFLLTFVWCGRVQPYGARYVTMSNVNPSGWCEYNFTMVFETQLPEDGFVEITFPRKDYPA